MSAKLINKWKLFKKIIDSTRQKYVTWNRIEDV